MRHAPWLLAAVVALAACQATEEAPPEPKGKTQTPPAASTAQAPATDAPAEAERAPAPPLQVEAWVNSEPLALAGLKGKVVVLDFWAFYCPPCIRLMPHLDELYHRHKDDGLVVIGVTENRESEVAKFLNTTPVTYPIAVDKLAEGEALTHEAYGIVAIPMALVIGRDGRIAWQGRGDRLTERTLEAELARP